MYIGQYPSDCLKIQSDSHYLIKYPASKRHGSDYGAFRSVIYRNDHTPVCFSPPKSIPFQSFNSEYIEFVWEFSTDKIQIIFNVNRDGNILLQENEKVGETYTQKYLTSGIITTKNLSYEVLDSLKNDVIEYLK